MPLINCEINLILTWPEDEGDKKLHTRYYLPKVEIKYYNVMIEWKNAFDQPVRNGIKTYDNTQEVSIGQWDDYTSGCLLDVNYFKEHYNMIVVDWNKQKEPDFNPKAIQQINFSRNPENQSTIFFIIEEAKETVLDFSQGTVNLF